MAEVEGSIHFAYELTAPDADLCSAAALAELNGWRSLLQRVGVIGSPLQIGQEQIGQEQIGQEQIGGQKDQGESFGFGSLSFRHPENPDQFFITATHTGGLAGIDDQQVVLITRCNLERFWVDAVGDQPPSSETLTHGMLYQADPRVHWVVHGRCAEIWQHHQALNLLSTAPDVAVGTAAMGSAVAGLLNLNQSRPLAFVTLGHDDGVFACGATIRDASNLLVNLLARALVMQHS